MAAETFTYSGNVYTAGVAGTTDFALISSAAKAIEYLEPSHIHVYTSANDGASWTELTRPAQWDFISSGTSVRLASGIAAGTWVKVQRITPTNEPYVTFQASSLLTAQQLRDDTLFNTYINQEGLDASASAVAQAEAAATEANQAVAAISRAILFSLVADVASIPATPTDGDAIEVTDSTGIESFSPLSGLPPGFIGSDALSIRITYSEASSTWVWLQYFPRDPESRYEPYDATILKESDIGLTVQAYNANLLTTGDIGVQVEAFDGTILRSADFATQAEAEAGSSGTTVMTPERTAQAIAALSSATSPGFPSGTSMLFVQTTAPTGWTKSTAHDNKALRVVSGTAGSGGTLAFTSAFASRTTTGNVGNTTLTINQIPSHTHTYAGYTELDNELGGFGNSPTMPGNLSTGATGGGLAHNHTYSVTTDFAVQYVDVIIATKD